MSDSSSQPTQPLTEDEESLIREWHNKTRDPKLGRVLDEVDRLRAENTALAAEIEVLKAAPEILASPDKAKRIASLVASSTRLVQLERDDARREVSRLRSALGLDQDGRGQADE